MNKQIEEMAKTLCEEYGECKKCTLSNPECENPCMVIEDCERLYNAGYRKASEVAREIFAEIERLVYSKCFSMRADRDVTGLIIDGELLSELKKKYEVMEDEQAD